MIPDISYLFTKNYWINVQYNVLRWKFFALFISLYGLVWGILEPILSFIPEKDAKELREYWWIYLILTTLIALLKSFPKFRYKYLIDGKDAVMELKIGDFFSTKADMIISANSHFITDLSNNLISPHSIQGQFTNKFYSNSIHLDNDLNNALATEMPLADSEVRYGKINEFKLGTTAKIEVRKKGKSRTAYLVAISRMNEFGVCNCSKEDFGEALGVMWNYLKERGSQGDLVMPVIGSGFARVDMKREDLIRFIAKSFVAANADRKVCNKLSIVVYPEDVNRYDMNIERVRNFLHYEINY